MRLVSLGRRWYLVAWDRDRQDWRTFRLDRITDVRAHRARFRPRELPAEDALAFVQPGHPPDAAAVRRTGAGGGRRRDPGRAGGAVGDGDARR